MTDVTDRTHLLTRLLQLEQRLYEVQQERDAWQERAAWERKRFYNERAARVKGRPVRGPR